LKFTGLEVFNLIVGDKIEDGSSISIAKEVPPLDGTFVEFFFLLN
jgi:hypothetical protein